MVTQVPIGKIAKFINGRAFKPSEWGTTGLPIIRIQNLTGSSNVVNYFAGEVDEKHLIFKGDILISWSASLGVYIWNGEDAILNQHIFKVITSSEVDELYFYYAIMNVLDEMVAQVHGSTMQHITKDPFEAVCIPLPPLDEQKRIAAILEEADYARRSRRFTQSLSDTFLQEVFVDMFGDPATNPMGWQEVELGKCLERIESGWSPVCEDRARVSNEWAVLSLGSITWGVFAPEENKLLPKDLHPRPDLEVKAGDLLFVRKNTYDLVGNSTYVFKTPPHLMLPDTIFRFRFKAGSEVNALYVWGLLNHPEFKKQKVQILASGTAGSMPNISKERLQTVVLPCPPPLKQRQFAETVGHYEQVINQQQESARQAEHLLQTLLHRAFRGEL